MLFTGVYFLNIIYKSMHTVLNKLFHYDYIDCQYYRKYIYFQTEFINKFIYS